MTVSSTAAGVDRKGPHHGLVAIVVIIPRDWPGCAKRTKPVFPIATVAPAQQGLRFGKRLGHGAF
jgi:hypothetical protein